MLTIADKGMIINMIDGGDDYDNFYQTMHPLLTPSHRWLMMMMIIMIIIMMVMIIVMIIMMVIMITKITIMMVILNQTGSPCILCSPLLTHWLIMMIIIMIIIKS